VEDKKLFPRTSTNPRLVICFVIWLSFYGEDFQHHAQPPSWRTTTCRLSAIVYSIYS
jgi:hypothetical protein